MLNSNNHYTYFDIQSSVTPVKINEGQLMDAIQPLQNGFLFIWLQYGKQFGTVSKGQYKFYDQSFNLHESNRFIVQVRAFNEKEEVFLRRSNSQYIGRHRVDNHKEGGLISAVDADLLLWGDYAETVDDRFSRLWSKRGTEIILPGYFSIKEGESNKKVVLTTRNYIGVTGIASYIDSRFVKFEIKENEKS